MSSKYRLPLPPPLSKEMQGIEVLLRDVLRRGMIFRPWLVTEKGEVVGRVPDNLELYLMKGNRAYRDHRDRKHEQVPPPTTAPAA
jgi:hypothetical protein